MEGYWKLVTSFSNTFENKDWKRPIPLNFFRSSTTVEDSTTGMGQNYLEDCIVKLGISTSLLGINNQNFRPPSLEGCLKHFARPRGRSYHSSN